MPESDALQSFRRRALRHAFEDGAIDIVLSCFAVMVGSATQRRALLGLVVVYLVLMTRAWKILHDRLSSRRTGFAELPGDPPTALLSVLLLAGCLTIAIVAALTLASGKLWNLEAWPHWMTMLSGSILAAGFIYTALKSGLVRFHVYALVSLAASLFFWLYPFGPRINPSDRLSLPFFVLGAVLLVGGLVSMARFVRTRPVAPQEVSGGR